MIMDPTWFIVAWSKGKLDTDFNLAKILHPPLETPIRKTMLTFGKSMLKEYAIEDAQFWLSVFELSMKESILHRWRRFGIASFRFKSKSIFDFLKFYILYLKNYIYIFYNFNGLFKLKNSNKKWSLILFSSLNVDSQIYSLYKT